MPNCCLLFIIWDMIMLACRKMARTNFAGFATASEIAQKTYAKFQKRYSDQSVSFNQRMYLQSYVGRTFKRYTLRLLSQTPTKRSTSTPTKVK